MSFKRETPPQSLRVRAVESFLQFECQTRFLIRTDIGAAAIPFEKRRSLVLSAKVRLTTECRSELDPKKNQIEDYADFRTATAVQLGGFPSALIDRLAAEAPDAFQNDFKESIASRTIAALRRRASSSLESNCSGSTASSPLPPTSRGSARVTPSQPGT